jgi:hypothetical protein
VKELFMLLGGRLGEKRNPLPPKVLIVTGMFLIAASLVWPRATFLQGTMSANGVDLIQGFLLGMAIAFEIMGIVCMAGRGKRMKNSSPDARD